jgi:hypothetical protein
MTERVRRDLVEKFFGRREAFLNRAGLSPATGGSWRESSWRLTEAAIVAPVFTFVLRSQAALGTARYVAVAGPQAAWQKGMRSLGGKIGAGILSLLVSAGTIWVLAKAGVKLPK